MTREEIMSMAKDVVSFLHVKDYDRQEIELILIKAREFNEDLWIREEEEE